MTFITPNGNIPITSRTYQLWWEHNGRKGSLLVSATSEAKVKTLIANMIPGCTVTHVQPFAEWIHGDKMLLRESEYVLHAGIVAKVLDVSSTSARLHMIGSAKATGSCASAEIVNGSPYRADYGVPSEKQILSAIECKETMPDNEQKQDEKKTKRAPSICLCGCGGTTSGGRFLPGHDAKLKGALIRASRTGDAAATQKLHDLGWGKYAKQ